ncbi:hypothetical protein Syun_021568 [Stephania yunnanensis]|uniref:Uncharacterized protein n=1 Tax=Stephania yunnanensis TaxID=152371 RepID=A0AAP0IFV9_9MAGN
MEWREVAKARTLMFYRQIRVVRAVDWPFRGFKHGGVSLGTETDGSILFPANANSSLESSLLLGSLVDRASFQFP